MEPGDMSYETTARITHVAVGAATFWVIHRLLMATWSWFDGAVGPPWFTASGRSVLFSVVTFAVVSAVVAALAARSFEHAMAVAAYITIGGAVTMAILLFLQPWGPGNIFPISIVIGTMILGIGSIGGSAAGWGLRSLRRTRSLR